MKEFGFVPFSKKDPEVIAEERSSAFKVIKITLIVLGVIVAVAAIALALYKFFKKYFVIDFGCEGCDGDCFTDYDIPEDEDFEPKCDLDAENE